MSLVLRNVKGSKLTIQEMDDNLTYLESLGNDLVDLTYSELLSTISSNSLVPGLYYKITDFKTCYDQPDYDIYKQAILIGNYKEGTVHPIVVMAISTNNLSLEAFQPDYPNDGIKYDHTWSITEVTGGTAYGRITERLDDKGNRTDYDHREVVFKRYLHYYYNLTNKLTGTIELGSDGLVTGAETNFLSLSVDGVIAIPGTLQKFFKIATITSNTLMTVTASVIPVLGSGAFFYSTGNDGYVSYYKNNVDPNDYVENYTFDEPQSYNNYFGNFANQKDFEGFDFILPNNVFKGGSSNNNKFGDMCFNNTFDDDCSNNKIGDWFHNNITNDDFDENFIGNYFSNNSINAIIQYNKIGENFQNNIIINPSFYRNDIGNYFSNNFIMNDNFYNNVIKDSFEENKIYDDFYENDIGNNFSINRIDTLFYENVIGNDFNNNITFSNFYNNVINESFYANNVGSTFSGNKIGNQFHSNTIQDEIFSDNEIGNDFDTNEILVQFVQNYINGSFNSNDIYSHFRENVTGINFDNNTIGATASIGVYDFESNQISDRFKGNLILGSFAQNSISKNFRSNQIYGLFQENYIGTYFEFNDLGDNFSYNRIGNSFTSNSVTINFAYNDIRNNFSDNNVADDFGFGGAEARGNIIGNYFQNNIVGEYFYDNRVGDLFESNIVGNYFQYNDVKTQIRYYDFTTYFGNILSVTFSTQVGSNGTYSGVTSSGGSGTASAFDITVSGGNVINVIPSGGGSPSYTGRFYAISDSLTILGSKFGGIDGTNLTLIVDSISATPSVYGYFNCDIFKTKGNENKLLYFDETTTPTITELDQ